MSPRTIKIGGGYTVEIMLPYVRLLINGTARHAGLWRRGGYVEWPRGMSSAVLVKVMDEIDARLRQEIGAGAGTVPECRSDIAGELLDRRFHPSLVKDD